MNQISLLYIVTALFYMCHATHLNDKINENDEIMYEAIKSGSIDNFKIALKDYPRDINEKPFILADFKAEPEPVSESDNQILAEEGNESVTEDGHLSVNEEGNESVTEDGDLSVNEEVNEYVVESCAESGNETESESGNETESESGNETESESGNEIKLSPLELAIACHKPEMIKILLEEKKPVIDIDTFVIVFKSSCVECFDILLDSAEELLEWNFNRDLIDKIQKYSVDNGHFFLFVSKFSKRLDFNNKLALIENAFNMCTDHDQIIMAFDTVELEMMNSNVKMILKKQYKSAIVYFVRYLIAKIDFDDLIPWVNDQFRNYPPDEDSMNLLKDYTALVKALDDRKLILAQPEDYLVKKKNLLKIELDNLIMGRKYDFVGPRVILKLITSDIEHLRADVRELLPEYFKQRDRALQKSITVNSIECLKVLLDSVDLNSTMVKDALRSSIPKNSSDLLKVFIEKGVNYNSLELCEYAIAMGAAGSLKILLENSAVGPDQDGLLVQAIKSNANDCVKVLLERGVNPNAVDDNLDPVLKISIEKQSLNCVRLLLEYGANREITDRNGNQPLIVAIDKESYDISETLLLNNANPNAVCRMGYTPLGMVMQKHGNQANFMRLLLDHNADPNVSGRYNWLPLVDAIQNNDSDTMKLLLEYKANPNLRDLSGSTPLTAAIAENSIEHVELLLESGANPEITFKSRNTALIWAIEKGYYEITEALLRNGANPNTLGATQETPLNLVLRLNDNYSNFSRLLLEYQADPNLANSIGSVLLVEAIRSGKPEFVKLLLEFKANPNLMDPSGDTPLIIAIERDSVEYLQLLINHGANIHVKNGRNQTLAKHAQSSRATRCLEFLLGKGVNIDS